MERPYWAYRLSQIRQRLGLSQEEFAEKLDMNVFSYRNYEYGRSYPTFEVLGKLYKLFGVNIHTLFSEEEERLFLEEDAKTEKKYLVGRRIQELMQALNISRGMLLESLVSVDDELLLDRYLKEEEAVPESVLKEIARRLGANFRWLIGTDERMFYTKKISFTEPRIDWIGVSGFPKSDSLFVSASRDDGESIYFAVHMSGSGVYEGMLLYDPRDYSVWNWFEKPKEENICNLYRNLRRLTLMSKSLFPIKVVEREVLKDLVFGKVHPKSVKISGSADIDLSVVDSYQELKGRPRYGFVRLISEWFSKCC